MLLFVAPQAPGVQTLADKVSTLNCWLGSPQMMLCIYHAMLPQGTRGLHLRSLVCPPCSPPLLGSSRRRRLRDAPPHALPCRRSGFGSHGMGYGVSRREGYIFCTSPSAVGRFQGTTRLPSSCKRLSESCELLKDCYRAAELPCSPCHQRPR